MNEAIEGIFNLLQSVLNSAKEYWYLIAIGIIATIISQEKRTK